MDKLRRFASFIDRVNTQVRIARFLILAMAMIVTLEVVLRYVFNRPTLWAWEVNSQILCACAILAGGYALVNREHVNVDLLYRRFSMRTKAIVDLCTSSLTFLFCGVAVWKMGIMAWDSLKSFEHAPTIWRPPLYPIKMIIAFGALLLLLASVSKFISDLDIVIGEKGSKNEH
jgi:TRAP-type mannitol/chloroaromatic compound transport system permease small subunit